MSGGVSQIISGDENNDNATILPAEPRTDDALMNEMVISCSSKQGGEYERRCERESVTMDMLRRRATIDAERPRMGVYLRWCED